MLLSSLDELRRVGRISYDPSIIKYYEMEELGRGMYERLRSNGNLEV